MYIEFNSRPNNKSGQNRLLSLVTNVGRTFREILQIVRCRDNTCKLSIRLLQCRAPEHPQGTQNILSLGLMLTLTLLYCVFSMRVGFYEIKMSGSSHLTVNSILHRLTNDRIGYLHTVTLTGYQAPNVLHKATG